MLTLFIGLVVGGCFGMIATAVLVAAGRSDEHFSECSTLYTPPGNAEKQSEEEHDESN